MLFTLIFGQYSEYSIPVDCKDQRHRRDFRALSGDEWTAFANAFQQLKASGKLSDFAQLHMDKYNMIHSVPDYRPEFLMWHRAFIWEFENQLREVSGNDNITMPYVDWAFEADYFNGFLDKSVAFDPYYYGYSESYHPIEGNMYDGNTKLRDSFIHEAGDVDYVYKWLNDTVPVSGWGSVDSNIIGSTKYDAFSQGLENGIHLDVHSRIGGLMITKISPMMSYFWAIHGFADMAGLTWQYVHNQHDSITAYYKDGTKFNGDQSFTILDSTYTYNQAFRLDGMCATYQRYYNTKSTQVGVLQKRSETPSQTAEAAATETASVPVQQYAKPNLQVDYKEVAAYNQKLKDYYTTLRTTNDPDKNMQTCADFYGNSTYIALTTTLPMEQLKKFNIDPATYQQTADTKNQRLLELAKLSNNVIHYGNETTTDYSGAENIISGIQSHFSDLVSQYASEASNLLNSGNSNNSYDPNNDNSTPSDFSSANGLQMILVILAVLIQ
eukprot:NODE_464_length_7114_cov_0.303350.p1 type:complete len:496 gc:universal NODE_464_length_7114_cov_0.303350:4418-5905(+)